MCCAGLPNARIADNTGNFFFSISMSSLLVYCYSNNRHCDCNFSEEGPSFSQNSVLIQILSILSPLKESFQSDSPDNQSEQSTGYLCTNEVKREVKRYLILIMPSCNIDELQNLSHPLAAEQQCHQGCLHPGSK